MTAPDPNATPPLQRVHAVRELAGLAGRKLRFSATEAERGRIVADFDLLSLDRFDIAYEIAALGKDGWSLRGRIDAALAQACVVSLAPAPSVVKAPFERVFSPGAVNPFDVSDAEVDVDLDEDDPPEPLGDAIDVAAAALETLALSLDPYPRAAGVAFAGASARPRDAAPIEETAPKPFASLAALKKTLEGGE